jgi:hypothetical protein
MLLLIPSHSRGVYFALRGTEAEKNRIKLWMMLEEYKFDSWTKERQYGFRSLENHIKYFDSPRGHRANRHFMKLTTNEQKKFIEEIIFLLGNKNMVTWSSGSGNYRPAEYWERMKKSVLKYNYYPFDGFKKLKYY